MANEYRIVNLETGNELFQFTTGGDYFGGDYFALAVETADDCALQLKSPVAVMSHMCDADKAHEFKSELYVAQP
jgi:hypothetical protein